MMLAEEPLQHVHNELHWRVIVLENEHPVHVWPLGLRLGLGDDSGARPALLVPALAMLSDAKPLNHWDDCLLVPLTAAWRLNLSFVTVGHVYAELVAAAASAGVALEARVNALASRYHYSSIPAALSVKSSPSRM
jgi:hypothetical protein